MLAALPWRPAAVAAAACALRTAQACVRGPPAVSFPPQRLALVALLPPLPRASTARAAGGAWPVARGRGWHARGGCEVAAAAIAVAGPFRPGESPLPPHPPSADQATKKETEKKIKGKQPRRPTHATIVGAAPNGARRHGGSGDGATPRRAAAATHTAMYTHAPAAAAGAATQDNKNGRPRRAGVARHTSTRAAAAASPSAAGRDP